MRPSELVDNGYLNSEFFKKAWKFSFVRNPFDRAVSLFEYLKSQQRLPPETSFSIFCQFLDENNVTPVGLYNHKSLSICNPQSNWTHDNNGKCQTDFIGKFETLQDDYDNVCDHLKIPTTLLQKQNSSSRQPLSTYYGAREIEIVTNFYKNDFIFFNYSTEFSQAQNEY